MRANSVGKKCTEVTAAYLAGLIDGDGSIMATIERHPEKKFGFRVRIALKVTQKNEQDVSFLPNLIGYGAVRKNGTTYDWITRDQKEIAVILKMIYPHLRIKLQQNILAQKIINTPVGSKEDLLLVATMADTLSRFNVRSNNRRKNYVTKIQEHFSSND